MSENVNHIHMGHLNNITYREIWFLLYRPQINLLMSGGVDNHLAALMLMWPCMERAFTLDNPEFDFAQNGGRVIPITDKVLDWFFRSESESEVEQQLDEIIDILHKKFVNGLKHDSFIRPGVALEDRVHSLVPLEQNGLVNIINLQTYRHPLEFDGNDVIIGPTMFWNFVRDKIDVFYIEKYGGK